MPHLAQVGGHQRLSRDVQCCKTLDAEDPAQPPTHGVSTRQDWLQRTTGDGARQISNAHMVVSRAAQGAAGCR